MTAGQAKPAPSYLPRTIALMNTGNCRGFSLVELLVIVIVAGILLGIAVPSYQSYILRSERTDATAALIAIAGSQERFYLQNGSYASTTQLAQLGFPSSHTERGYYRLSIKPHMGGLSVGYTAKASTVMTEKQAADSDCAAFSIDEMGHRGANGRFDPIVVLECWR